MSVFFKAEKDTEYITAAYHLKCFSITKENGGKLIVLII